MSSSRIVFIVSGSIAAFKAAQVVSRLVQNGHELRVVATPSALRFVGAATFEGLTNQPVLSDLWEHGRAMDHIHLSRWADFGVICPASASTIGRMANGLSEDLVGALTLAWPLSKPLHLFPAMNSQMLSHPATAANLSRLEEMGLTVHPTGGGSLACGEVGDGRLLEPDDIIARITPVSRGRILITAGATREPIDGIRFISNVSTGRTGAGIADRLTARGWDVTFVHGEGSALPTGSARRMAYGSFESLDRLLREELGANEYNAVIHAAAVSDYSVATINGHPVQDSIKVSSDKALNLQLRTNHKILPLLRGYSKKSDTIIIGFKLTLNQTADETIAIGRRLLSSGVDAIIANDWSNISADSHPGHLVSSDGEREFRDITALCNLLDETLH